MASKRSQGDIDQETMEKVASLAVKHLEDLIAAMQSAQEQVSSGTPLEAVHVADFQLYLARTDNGVEQGRIRAVATSMEYEEFVRLIKRAACESGIRLEAEATLEVTLPEAEFGDGLVTGGFGNFKGIAVEVHNDCLMILMEEVCKILERRGLAVRCIPDEDVIFYLSVAQEKGKENL
ncbi:Uncharacterised protein [uncultured archaeon]|nr:Uncharacterised protein [uncultured archaeon]